MKQTSKSVEKRAFLKKKGRNKAITQASDARENREERDATPSSRSNKSNIPFANT